MSFDLLFLVFSCFLLVNLAMSFSMLFMLSNSKLFTSLINCLKFIISILLTYGLFLIISPCLLLGLVFCFLLSAFRSISIFFQLDLIIFVYELITIKFSLSTTDISQIIGILYFHF